MCKNLQKCAKTLFHPNIKHNNVIDEDEPLPGDVDDVSKFIFLVNAGNNASMKKTLMGVCILDKVDKVGGLSHFNQISHDYKRTISNSCQKAGASETISLKDIEIKGGLIQSHPKLF